jgi:hypothetical protein
LVTPTPNHQHTLKVGTELVPELPENLHILTWLSDHENFTEFCHHDSFKTYTKTEFAGRDCQIPKNNLIQPPTQPRINLDTYSKCSNTTTDIHGYKYI